MQGEVAWPPIICREIAVKLNNLTDAAVRMGGLDHQLAAHLARCGDPLLRGDTSPVAPPPPSAAVVSERLRLHGTSGRSLQASVQALDDTADDLSFMSDAFDGARSQVRPSRPQPHTGPSLQARAGLQCVHLTSHMMRVAVISTGGLS